MQQQGLCLVAVGKEIYIFCTISQNVDQNYLIVCMYYLLFIII